MKKFATLACCIALAGCGTSESADAPVGEEVVKAAPVEEPVFDPVTFDSTESAAGSYDLVYADSTIAALTLNKDGTATFSQNDETYSSRYTVPAPGKFCFSGVSPGGQKAQCWTNDAQKEDGTWTARGEDGQVVTMSSIGV